MAIKLPSAMFVPQVAIQSDPGVQSSPATFGGAMGPAVEDAGQDIGQTAQSVGLKMQEVARREQRRSSALTMAREYNAINRDDPQSWEDLKAETDISDPAVIEEWIQGRTQRDLERLSVFEGNEDDRADYELMLLDLQDRYNAVAWREHNKAVVAAGETAVNAQLQPLLAMAHKDPGKVEYAYSEADRILRRSAGLFSATDENTLRATVNDQIGKITIDGLLSRGNVDGAQDAVDTLMDGGLIRDETYLNAQRRIDQINTN